MDDEEEREEEQQQEAGEAPPSKGAKKVARVRSHNRETVSSLNRKRQRKEVPAVAPSEAEAEAEEEEEEGGEGGAAAAPAPAPAEQNDNKKKKRRMRSGRRAYIHCKKLQQSEGPLLSLAHIHRAFSSRIATIIQKQAASADGPACMTEHGVVLGLSRHDKHHITKMPQISKEALLAVRAHVEDVCNAAVGDVSLQMASSGRRKATADHLYCALRIAGHDGHARAIMHLTANPKVYSMVKTSRKTRPKTKGMAKPLSKGGSSSAPAAGAIV